MDRKSGILMHISSLQGEYGIGTFGEHAYEFVDFLKKAGQKYWQILPLGQTGFGDSPYQSFSAFAGNPYFIDFDILHEDGLLNKEDYENINFGDKNDINYGLLFIEKFKVLRIAYENFKHVQDEEYEKFKEDQKLWLHDYAMYMAIKKHFNLKSWQNWDKGIKKREPQTLKRYNKILSDDIGFWKFIQFIFFKQWFNLKNYANSLGIEIIGDMPIYVSEDSVDVWSNQKAFLLDENQVPTKVAGCPPDAFSKTGQLWGNPIYDWNYLESTNYKWWIDRVRESLKMYDVVRIDHFRGFESYWEIPYGEETAINGKWVKGGGIKLFRAIKEALGDIKVIAEDLGYLTDDVIRFRDETGFAGMKILQFAFDGREDNEYLPNNYIENCVAYTGTHDNDTVKGWLDKATQDEFNRCKDYLNLNEDEGYNWGFIKGVWNSKANISIAQMQDFLNLGSEARTNVPSTTGTNWKWRIKNGSLTDNLANKIYSITKLCGRC